MESVAIALIGLAGNIGGVLLNCHLREGDKEANINIVKVSHTIGPIRIEETPSIRKSALFSFIFGLVGIFLGGLFSMATIISAKQALRDIKFFGNDPRSAWYARAGLQMGYLGTILLLIAITVFTTLYIKSVHS
jgi:hypothetical protein